MSESKQRHQKKLKNPAGHYRKTVQKFYESRAKRRDWDIRNQMRALEAKIGLTADRIPKKPLTCSLSRCSGTGECWDEAGFVSACECDIGRGLSSKVLAVFDEMNVLRRNEESAAKEISQTLSAISSMIDAR